MVTGMAAHPLAGRVYSVKKKLEKIGPNTYRGSMMMYPTDSVGLSFMFSFDLVNDSCVNWQGLGAIATVSSGLLSSDNPGNHTYGDPKPGDSPWQHSTFNNRFDPTTNTLYLHYGYSTTTVSNERQYTRQIYEKWEKTP